MKFQWDEIQRLPHGQILLLYRHQRVFDEGLIRPGSDVLDIGGWGILAQAVIESGSTCTILDLFTEDQYYPDRVKSLPHKYGDVLNAANFLGGSFDLVTCFEVLEHVVSADIALANIHTWLRPSGVLAGTVPIPGFCHHADQPGITFLDEATLREKLSAAGFEDVVVEPTGSINTTDRAVSLYFKGRKPR